MSCLVKVLCAVFSFLLLLDIVQNSPLFQGFSVQKGFEVKLKPFEFKPISFFKEKWSPFGRFGIRKGIQKRDLATLTRERLPPRPSVVPPAPVFEFLEESESNKIVERKENTQAATELQPGPDPISSKPISSNLIRIPLTESFKPPTEGLYTSIGRNPPVQITPKPIEQVFGELPPRPVGPVPEPVEVSPQPILVQPISPVPIQPISPVPVQPVPPRQPIPAEPIRPEILIERPNQVLFQPVGQNSGPSMAPVSEVIPLITPPPRPISPVSNTPLSEIPPTDGPLVRGSKVALYFGNVLLQLVSQFLTNARLQFSQLKQNPLPELPLPPAPINNS